MSMPCKRLHFFSLACVLMSLLCLNSAQAQSAAQLSGVVQDPTHAVVPVAHVTLTSQATSVVTATTTNASGRYVFPYVLPGTYTLSAEHAGFAVWNATVTLHANGHIAVNITLPIGKVNQSVHVSTNSEGVQADSGQRSETLTSQQIRAMSTEGTNTEELLNLLPGVVENGTSAYGNSFSAGVLTAGNGGGVDGFNIDGNRADANTYELDGGDMDDVTGNSGGNIYPNSEFISEISVETSNYSADQGGSPILVVASTKSGTKDFHGEGFWVGRNYLFNANDWSNKYAGIARPQSKFNYPGFDLGGPILLPWTHYNRGAQRKLLFFVGAEWSRQLPDLGTQLADVPTAGMLTGDFSSIVNSGPCTAARANGTASSTTYLNQPCVITDPATGNTLDQQNGQLSSYTANGVGLLKSLLGPNLGGSNYTDPRGKWNYAGHPLYAENLTQYVARFDWDPSDKARMFIRLGKQNQTLFSPWGEYSAIDSTWTSNVPDPTPAITKYNSNSLNWSVVSVLSPTLTNEAVFNANALDVPSAYQNATLLSKAHLGVDFTGVYNNGYPEVPQIVPNFGVCDSLNESGCAGGEPGEGRWGASNLVGMGNYYKETQFEYKDNLTKVMGAHLLKFGALAERARNNQNSSDGPLGGELVTSNWTTGTSGNEYADILTEHFAEFVQANHDVVAHMRSWSWDWYGQDSWKVRKNLTLDYGIRWTLAGPWYDVNGLGATFDPTAYTAGDSGSAYDGVRTASCKNPGQSAVPLCGTVPKTVLPYGHPLTQARIGFSWDTRGNGQTVLRGGVGEYTQRDPTNASFGALLGPPNQLEDTIAQSGATALDLAQIEASTPGSQGGYTYGDSDGVYSKTDDKHPEIYQYNLTLDQRLPSHFATELAYVGSESRHLEIEQNIDSIPYGKLWTPGTHLVPTSIQGDEVSVAPYNPFSQIVQLQHSGDANYNALQVTLRREQTHSLDFLASYTFSKALGQSDEFEAPLPDPFSTAGSYHVLAFDRTHVFSIGYQYYLPSLRQGSGLAHAIAGGALNGWMLSGITTASSGGPIAVSAQVNCVQQEADGSTGTCAADLWDESDTWFGTNAWGNTYEPGTETSPAAGVYVAFSCDPRQGHQGSINSGYINTKCVTLPSFGQQGDIDPPYIKSPGSLNFNLAIQKSFPMGGSRHLDVRISSFNLTNTAQAEPINTVATFNWVLPVGATDPDQGHAVLTNGTGNCLSSVLPLGYSCEKTGSRQMEGSVKFFF